MVMAHPTEDRQTELVEWTRLVKGQQILILNPFNGFIYLSSPISTTLVAFSTPRASLLMYHSYMVLNSIQNSGYGISDAFTSHFTSLDEFMEYYLTPDKTGVQLCQSSSNGQLPIVITPILMIFIFTRWLSCDSGALEKLSTFGAFKKFVLVFRLFCVVVYFKAIQQDIRILVTKDVKSYNCGIFIYDNLIGILCSYVRADGNFFESSLSGLIKALALDASYATSTSSDTTNTTTSRTDRTISTIDEVTNRIVTDSGDIENNNNNNNNNSSTIVSHEKFRYLLMRHECNK